MENNVVETKFNEDSKEDEEKLNEKNIQLLESIKSFFNGPNKDENGKIEDISYELWVEKNPNIKKLCESYEVEYKEEQNLKDANSIKKNNKSKNPFGIIENHDFGCELKLLKWITEDENHKKKFIKFENINKLNRYNDILPYEYNSVSIDINKNDKNDINNYINGSYISSPFDNKTKLFIATQTPLKDNISSFWKMIYNKKIKLIIMLSDLSEEKEGKYNIYWPNNKEENLKYNEGDLDLNIELIHKEDIAPQIAILRKFKINNDLEVKQIQIISWPERGIPTGEDYLVHMVFEKLLKRFNDQIKDNIPVVVHCYDGVGRTGTLISIFLINMCLEKLKILKEEPTICIFNVIRRLREQRYSFVTDKEQYKFIYHFTLYWIKKNYPLW